MDEKLDRRYTVPEVADYLKISKAKIYYLVQREEIPHVRIGRNVRIQETDLKKWIEKRTYQPRLPSF